MQFLSQTQPYPDETIESYFLRLTKENGYLDFSDLADALWDWLVSQDHELEGAFPNNLKDIDVYKAVQSSNFRIRALSLVAKLAGLGTSSLINLCWLRSNTRFGELSAISRDNFLVPRLLIRKENIPICIECLREHEYVPYYWHLRAYKACHKHNKQLIGIYGENLEESDYRLSESFHSDVIVFPPTTNLNEYDLKLSKALASNNAKSLVGLIAWFSNFKNTSIDSDEFSRAFTNYFSNWPESFTNELNEVAETARIKQILPFNQTKFYDVFGDVLKTSQIAHAGSQGQNIVQTAILKFFTDLVAKHPKSKHPNIGDLLLSTQESSVLLNTNYEQVYRLYEEGFLASSYPLKKHERLQLNQGIFHLRQVIELCHAFATNEAESSKQFVPPW